MDNGNSEIDNKIEEAELSLLNESRNKITANRKTSTKDDIPEENYNSSFGFFGLFRYSTRTEIFLMLFGTLCSILQGTTFPVLGFIFGQMCNELVKEINHSTNITSEDVKEMKITRNVSEDYIIQADEFYSTIGTYTYYYILLAIVSFTASFLQNYLWEISAERQLYILRRLYFSQILRQDLTWFDTHEQGDLSSKLSDDIERIRDGIGYKFSIIMQYVSTFISAFVIGLCLNWKLTCVLMCLSPFIIGATAALAKMASAGASREQIKYSLASGIAEEVLACLKTVVTFGGEAREVYRYGEALKEGRKTVMKTYYCYSFVQFVVHFITYSSYGIAFWYGSTLIANGLSTAGNVLSVFFCIIYGAFSIGNILPHLNAISIAVGCAHNVFMLIDRRPKIDPYSNEGLCLNQIKGIIEFKNVSFVYPKRKEAQILNGFDLTINPGEKVAITGPSGAGKTTLVNLLLRFYDPDEGQITIDGYDLRKLNLKWLRNNIGLVSQEPVLFGATIADNIRYGRENVTLEDIENASKLANADSFIKELPHGYNTELGDRGTQLSGGQKQRIAIARALIRNPKLILLDEATSALDSQNEIDVQKALENAFQGRTTIIIAHRLSTIKNADKIIVFKDGKIVETGNHEKLLKNKDLYFDLVTTPEEKNSDLEKAIIGSHNGDCNQNVEENVKLQNENLLKKTPNHTIKVGRNVIIQLLKLSTAQWHLLLAITLFCILFALTPCLYAYLFGEYFAVFKLSGSELEKAATFWFLMFVLLGVYSGSTCSILNICMLLESESLIARLRLLTFKNILTQEISWFDNESYSIGRLLTRLARDAATIKSVSAMKVGQILICIATVIFGVLLAMFYGWKLTLFLIFGISIFTYTVIKQNVVMRQNITKNVSLMDSAGKVVSECLQHIKTVQALGREKAFVNQYLQLLDSPKREGKKLAIFLAFILAISQAMLFLIYAGSFKIGSYLIVKGEMSSIEVFRVFFALVLTANAVGFALSFQTDWSKGKIAAKMILDLIGKKSTIDSFSSEGIRPEIRGKLILENVIFSYPSRPNVTVLQGLNVSVEAGQCLALVGASGCGKSTIISLIERFYTANQGKIYLDDYDITTLNVAHLRAQMGSVTQEPVLFRSSIKENIAYGALHSQITDQDIIEAARIANIHESIIKLPEGYETLCGDRGTRLSGGQKQRIAIARAVLRKPKILLLDEPTSSLDVDNERAVKEALDRARIGRTTIVIAHRLSTIQNADKIAVIHEGTVVEVGTHEELKELKGHYYGLMKQQNI